MPQGNEQFNSPEAVYTARTLGSVGEGPVNVGTEL